jgi:hypothetical protein
MACSFVFRRRIHSTARRFIRYAEAAAFLDGLVSSARCASLRGPYLAQVALEHRMIIASVRRCRCRCRCSTAHRMRLVRLRTYAETACPPIRPPVRLSVCQGADGPRAATFVARMCSLLREYVARFGSKYCCVADVTPYACLALPCQPCCVAISPRLL